MSKNHEDSVVLIAKTPLLPRGTAARVSAGLTVRQGLDALRRQPAKDANAVQVLRQLDRETEGHHEILAVKAEGEVVKIDPAAPLKDLAVDREVRTPNGIKRVPTVAVEVQAYTPVGAGI